jgi:heme exporter protein B
MLALAFFASVAALVPLGIGPDLKLLARIAGGVLWIAASLAALLSLDRLFQADFEDGSLDLIALAPHSLEATAFAKIAAHWLTTGLPLTVLSPLLGLLFGLPPQAYPALMLSLLIGTPAISAIGAVGASITLSIRRGGLILPLIVLPLLSPAVIFGAGAVLAVLDGSPNGALALLAAFSLVSVVLAPFACAAGVRLNLAG